MSDILKKEDYEEPRCLLCDEPEEAKTVHPVPQQRIIEKMDEYMSRRDYTGAERHLKYWLEEAKAGNDLRGQLMLYNELTGHYRKIGEKEKSLSAAENALQTVEKLGMAGTVSAGTSCVNAATAYSAFGEKERALELFEQAEKHYEEAGNVPSHLLGGLYNNMALVLVALKRFRKAHERYDRAMELMAKVEGGVLEQAITCLNRADAWAAELGEEDAEPKIFPLLDEAYDLLKTPEVPRDGYYAFVLEKCAPGFAYYGYFAAAEEFKKESERIYEGT
ncbi:MAG: tetratricopeptide repeat protein [Eubacterium sp.]|nr:tetratricopeptide repeat protein [Eubacterium sp.]